MNGTQQRQHRTVTQSLEARLANVEDIVAATLPLFRRTLEVHDQQLSDEMSARLRFEHQTFWGRLRWVICGY